MIGYNGLNNITWFLGYCEQSYDPLGAGRIKVRAFGFHPTVTSGEVSTEDLPWAFVSRPDTQHFATIEIGALVLGFFLDGRDAQQPIVIGTISSANFATPAQPPRSQVDRDRQGGTSSSAAGGTINTDIPPYGRAFLDAIAAVEMEQSPNSYDMRNGGSTFDINQGHPGPSYGPGGTSSASGRYQFTFDTWYELHGNTNPLMTPENQDAAAWKLAQQRYYRYTDIPPGSGNGRNLDNDLLTNGISPEIFNILSPTWSTFTPEHMDILLSTYNQSMNLQGTAATTETGLVPEDVNDYMCESNDVLSNLGNLALPPQMTGEDIHRSPILPATVARKESSSRNGSYTISEPSIPVGGNHKSSVWNTRYEGSYIEMHAGQDVHSEFINIVHSSGSRVGIDQNGNVTIHSTGRVHIASDNDYEENIEGHSTNISKGGYRISVTSGKVEVESSGDMNFTAGGNLNLQAGGDVLINAGESVDIAGARIGAHARADTIDIVAAQKMTLQSGSLFGIKTSSVVGIQAKGIGLNAGSDNLKLKGGKIYLNDAAGTPADVADANATRTPAPPEKGFSSESPANPTPSSISPDQTDNVSGPQ